MKYNALTGGLTDKQTDNEATLKDVSRFNYFTIFLIGIIKYYFNQYREK